MNSITTTETRDLTEPATCPQCGRDLESGPFGLELVCPSPECAPTAPPTSTSRQAGVIWSERAWGAFRPADDRAALAQLGALIGVAR